jgi:hypothetical protein
VYAPFEAGIDAEESFTVAPGTGPPLGVETLPLSITLCAKAIDPVRAIATVRKTPRMRSCILILPCLLNMSEDVTEILIVVEVG